MFSVIDRYIGKSILNTILLTLFLLVGLSGIIKFIDQLRKVRADYDACSAGLYTVLSIPKDIELFFPMAALLGALIGLGTLAARSELVVMEASGVTRLRIAGSVMKTAIPLVLITMAMGEWVAPAGEQAARNMRAQKLFGNALLSTQGSMWAKDGLDFIYISHVTTENQLQGINIYKFNEKRRLDKIIAAQSAEFINNQWVLSNIEESDLRDEKQIVGTRLATLDWKTNITPDKLSVVAMNPEALSAQELSSYIHYLKATGQESSKYRLLFWAKVFKPLSVAVMMLMALSFIFGPLRSVSLGVKIITGISFGFLFYLLDKVFGPLSIVYEMPPWLGAILPSAIFMLLSLYLLKKRRA